MHPDPSSHARSLVKGLTWESFALVITLIVAYAVLGDVRMSLRLTLISQGIKICFFYLHERAWHRVRWGKQCNP